MAVNVLASAVLVCFFLCDLIVTNMLIQLRISEMTAVIYCETRYCLITSDHLFCLLASHLNLMCVTTWLQFVGKGVRKLEVSMLELALCHSYCSFKRKSEIECLP